MSGIMMLGVVMKSSDLADLLGKECVSIESGRGMVVSVDDFHDDERLLYADLRIVSPSMFEMNRIRGAGDPAIRAWHDIGAKVGKIFTISTERGSVFRQTKSFLHFSLPVGGIRLLFLPEYVRKVNQKDGNGWEWDEMMRNAGRSVERSPEPTSADRPDPSPATRPR